MRAFRQGASSAGCARRSTALTRQQLLQVNGFVMRVVGTELQPFTFQPSVRANRNNDGTLPDCRSTGHKSGAVEVGQHQIEDDQDPVSRHTRLMATCRLTGIDAMAFEDEVVTQRA
jgi:hypothetical protein